MKNADMKVIAIILSIALLITLFVSNGVSVASVVMLFLNNGGTTVTDDAGNTGDTSNNGGTVSGGTVSGGTVSGGTVSGGTVSGGTTSGGTTSGGTTSGGTADNGGSGSAQQGTDANAGNAGATDANDPVLADPFAFYSKAANEIHTKGNAGYKKIGWQAVEGQLTLDKLQFLAGTLTDLIAGFMTEKDAAEVKDCPKGSDDAKNRMPASNCSSQYIKSDTAVKEGDNYVITIVLTEFVNPSYDDPDGLQLMSREFLDFKDVLNEVANNDTVKAVVKSVDGTITYTDYTITATMTSDGKFIKIVHYGVGNIVADVQAIAGSLNASGALSFNAEYYDFVY
ncbi:MAG: hypothetical protein IJ025_05465 [Clostridia bacterium]|nr:hypothetical protein [Clostridia bacterium]